MSDPSQPLKNARWERFAIARSKGADLGAAWKSAMPFGKKHSGDPVALRVAGHRCQQREEVAARIQHLIRESRRTAPEDSPEVLTRSDIVQAALECTEALEMAHIAALRSSVSPQAVERLRSVLAAHLARQGKLTEDQGDPLPDPDAFDVAGLVDRISLHVCTCPVPVEDETK